MSTIFDVSNYIINRQRELTTMKLQKLCYYSQAWSLVWDEEPLFQEDFYAWGNGPVNPELFQEYKGQFKIKLPSTSTLEVNLNESQIETIDAILNHYGDFDGVYLSDLTHLEDPWKNARVGYAPGSRSNVLIEKEAIQEYYAGI